MEKEQRVLDILKEMIAIDSETNTAKEVDMEKYLQKKLSSMGDGKGQSHACPQRSGRPVCRLRVYTGAEKRHGHFPQSSRCRRYRGVWHPAG